MELRHYRASVSLSLIRTGSELHRQQANSHCKLPDDVFLNRLTVVVSVFSRFPHTMPCMLHCGTLVTLHNVVPSIPATKNCYIWANAPASPPLGSPAPLAVLQCSLVSGRACHRRSRAAGKAIRSWMGRNGVLARVFDGWQRCSGVVAPPSGWSIRDVHAASKRCLDRRESY